MLVSVLKGKEGRQKQHPFSLFRRRFWSALPGIRLLSSLPFFFFFNTKIPSRDTSKKKWTNSRRGNEPERLYSFLFCFVCACTSITFFLFLNVIVFAIDEKTFGWMNTTPIACAHRLFFCPLTADRLVPIVGQSGHQLASHRRAFRHFTAWWRHNKMSMPSDYYKKTESALIQNDRWSYLLPICQSMLE